MISQLYLYPNGYGVVVLAGLMFATIICYIHEFVTYSITKCHIIVVTWALMVCQIHTPSVLRPAALGI